MATIVGYGTSPYGTSPYGSPTILDFDDGREQSNNLDYATDNWDNDAIDVYPGRTAHDLLDVLLTDNRYIDDRIDEIFDATHLDTASGKSLDRLAQIANLERKQGESDDKFRARIRATMMATSSGTTFDEVLQFLATLLSIPPEEIQLNWSVYSNPATVFADIYESDIRQSPLTADEIGDLASEVVAAGGDVRLNVGGTFELIEVGGSIDSSKGLSTLTETNGTLGRVL